MALHDHTLRLLRSLLLIGGSFHVSTMDYMRLVDGARFSARLADTSVLSVAPPAAFGFLEPTPAAIAIRGSTLHVPEHADGPEGTRGAGGDTGQDRPGVGASVAGVGGHAGGAGGEVECARWIGQPTVRRKR